MSTRTQPRRIRILKWTALLAVLAYLGAVGYLVAREKALIFHPDVRHVAAPAEKFGLNQRTVTYASTDDITLSAWVVPAASVLQSGGMWMLICHGNFGNIGYGQRPEFYSLMRDLGLNLLAFDYRGFGDSTGAPSERGLYADARASYDYLTRTLHVPPEKIVIFGHSLGSGVAIELATRVPAAALVVEGAYTSVTDRAQELYPLLPIQLVSSQRFASIDRIASINVPKLFLHSPEDAVIPYAHGERLFAAARSPKQLVSVQGGHEDAYSIDRKTYYGAIAQLVQDVAPKR
jgi:fermentation-respiration switch protein FrsA (DUF1100 family)